MNADRLSGLFFVIFGIALYFAIIPTYVEQSEGGNLAPNTLPNFLSIVIAGCGFFLLIKPTNWKIKDKNLFGIAALYGIVISCGVYAMTWFGFLWVSPLLAMAMMLLMGERRLVWLALGAVATPMTIWFFVVQILDRALP